METKTKSVKFRGWKILLNPETGWYDLYLPDDAETYTNKELREYASPEMEDIPTVEEAKNFIRNY